MAYSPLGRGVLTGKITKLEDLAQGQNIVPIFGTKRRIYLEENIGALDVSLTAEDLKRLDELIPKGAAAGARYGETMMTLIGKAP